MSVEPEIHPLNGIRLPPRGAVLALLLAIYIFSGLVGHDPWKTDDAVTIGVVHDIVSHANWLTPGLAGRPYPDAPLYYWLAAATAHLFSWLLPVHEGARLASGICTLLALTFILLAARELHDRAAAPAAPLLLAGSIGFLFHAHEAQPMLATLTAHTAAYWGLTLIKRKPLTGASCFGLALGLGFLANGLVPMLSLLPIAGFVAWRSERPWQTGLVLLAALFLAGAIAACWAFALLATRPDFLQAFWREELLQLTGSSQPLLSFPRVLLLLTWYAWPALPLAGWTVWARRRQLLSPQLSFPIFAFLTSLVVISVCFGTRSAPTLLLLPSLVLLATPGVSSLRRGAANAFDWFAMVTFSLFALVAWTGWVATTFGWPERLASEASRLEPGFTPQFSVLSTALALAATLIWSWLIVTSPRSPMRGIMHWMAGLTLFWFLIATLWMPWIDYGKSYRPLSAGLARALPEKRGCIANGNLGDSLLASLDYFHGIRTVGLYSDAGVRCNLLLVQGSLKDESPLAGTNWRKIWEGARPADRRESEKLKLYRRDDKMNRRASGAAEPSLLGN